MANDLLRKVRKIEIKTRKLSHQIFAGEYHSAFKGRGMAFSEVREYQYGDDVRNMDWNVTARLRSPFIKVFEEERELTVMLLIDVSRSRLFGTVGDSKKDLMAEIAAVISFSASINNDKVGALFFSDRVELFIPPKKGRTHLLRIISSILELEPKGTGTDIGAALRFLTNALKRKCTAFLLSDMMDLDASGRPRYEDVLKVAVNRHDIAAVNVYDRMERNLPDIGLVHIKDSESGEGLWVDTSRRKVREHHDRWMRTAFESTRTLFNKYKVDNVSIATDQDYVKGLMTLFNRR